MRYFLGLIRGCWVLVVLVGCLLGLNLKLNVFASCFFVNIRTFQWFFKPFLFLYPTQNLLKFENFQKSVWCQLWSTPAFYQNWEPHAVLERPILQRICCIKKIGSICNDSFFSIPFSQKAFEFTCCSLTRAIISQKYLGIFAHTGVNFLDN